MPRLGRSQPFPPIVRRPGTPAATAYDSIILAETGLVSYWKLGEASPAAAADSRGSNTGTYTGGVTLAQSGIPMGGNAILLDGSTGYVSVPDATSLHLTGSFSLEAWIRPSSTSTSLFSRIIAKPASASVVSPYNDYALECNSSGPFSFDLTNSGAQQTISGGPALSTTQWYHVVGTYDGSNQKLYINAGTPASRLQNGAVAANTQPLQIGRLIGGNYFGGLVGRVAIYNTALSSTQVSAHYTTGTAVPAVAYPASLLMSL